MGNKNGKDMSADAVDVLPSAAVHNIADLTLQIGFAFDGLPLLLKIRRSVSVKDSICRSLNVQSILSLPKDVADHIEKLESSLFKHVLKAGVVDNAYGKWYRSNTKVQTLIGNTVMNRILGAQSAIGKIGGVSTGPRFAPSLRCCSEEMAYSENSNYSSGSGSSSRPTKKSDASSEAGAVSSDDFDIKSVIGGNSYLAIQSTTGLLPKVMVERVLTENEKDGKDRRRSFTFEQLTKFPSARAEISYSDWPDYKRHVIPNLPLAKLLKYTKLPYKNGNLDIKYSVSRADVAIAIVAVAKELQSEYHNTGRVHSDIKPSNILMTKSGVKLIDGLGVRTGKTSPVASFGWAAPEQILGQAVGAATDVFPLGLMLASLLQASLFGEEKTFVIPLSGGRSKRTTILTDPGVNISTKTATVAGGRTGALAHSGLICQALAYDKTKRFADAAQFATAFEALCVKYPVQGRIDLKGTPGTPVIANVEKKQVLAHVLRDTQGALAIGQALQRSTCCS